MKVLDAIRKVLRRDRGPVQVSQPIDFLSGGVETASGVELTPEGALSSTAVLAAVERLSSILAMLPLIVYRRTESGRRKKSRAPDHPLYRLLHDTPNPEMTAVDFREMMQASALIRGSAYAEIERNKWGAPVHLWPLRSDKTRMERKKGRLWFMVERNGKEFGLRPEQVFHVKGFSVWGLVGLCRTDLCREAIGTGLAQEEYQSRFFANSAMVKGVLESPGTFEGAKGEEALKRLRESWHAAHGGLSKAHRVGILEDGMTFRPTGISNEDAELIAGRTFQTQEVSRIFGTQPHLMAELSHATFTNIEHQSLEFVKFTLGPWLVRWEQRILKELILPSEYGRYFAEFLVDGLLRGDSKSRAEFYRTLWNMGVLSANDIRDLENMNPLPGGQGDLYMIPMNMVPAEKWTEEDAQPGAAVPQGDPEGEGEEDEEGGEENDGEDDTRAEIWDPGTRTLMTGGGADPTRKTSHGEMRDVGAANRRRIRDFYRGLLAESAQRFVEAGALTVRAQAAESRENEDQAGFRDWLREFFGDEFAGSVAVEMRGVLESLRGEIASAAADEVGEAAPSEEDLEEFFEGYLAGLGRREARYERLRLQLAGTGEETVDAYFDAVEGELEGLEEERAGQVADEERVKASDAVAKAVWVLSGRTVFRWIANAGACPLCESLDGKVVGVEENFVNTGDVVDPEDGETAPLKSSGNVGHAPLHKGCECTIGPE